MKGKESVCHVNCNIHPFLYLAILLLHPVQPSMTCLLANPSFCTQVLPHLRCGHHIHYILCMNVTFFRNSFEVEMYLLHEILVIKNGGIEMAIVIDW